MVSINVKYIISVCVYTVLVYRLYSVGGCSVRTQGNHSLLAYTYCSWLRVN